jgi:nucleoside-diphosphate-sugar epimerase
VDVKKPQFRETAADEYFLADLRQEDHVDKVFVDGFINWHFDEVYQLAADMGGMGYISQAECEIMHGNALINANVLDHAYRYRAKRYFFSSSVCVYRDMALGESALTEDDAYPAQPDNEYGWEKLYAERMALAYGRRYGMQIRIARFQNTYGPYGTWRGGREKAPAAICRKVAEAPDGGEIEVWGDGTAVRNYTYVSDLVDGIVMLMRSEEGRPCNIGSQEYVSVDDLVRVVADVAGKSVRIKHVDGPVGVQSRNFSTARIEALGWRPEVSLRTGIGLTYPWIAEQVRGEG